MESGKCFWGGCGCKNEARGDVPFFLVIQLLVFIRSCAKLSIPEVGANNQELQCVASRMFALRFLSYFVLFHFLFLSRSAAPLRASCRS